MGYILSAIFCSIIPVPVVVFLLWSRGVKIGQAVNFASSDGSVTPTSYWKVIAFAMAYGAIIGTFFVFLGKK